MADRVHPRDSPSAFAEAQTTSSTVANAVPNPKPPMPPPSEKPVPPPGTYIIKVPKDQVYRVPPPENARRFDEYTRRKHRRSRCCCFCWLIGFLFVVVVLLGIAAGVLYLVFRTKAPKYTIDRIAIKGINVTSTAAISPEFDVTVRADNPNNKIGIRYESDSSAEIFYKDLRLSNGGLPAFYQPSNNVTVFQTVLKGDETALRPEDRGALLTAQKKGEVPLLVKLRAPVKIKIGTVKTWKITVKVDCDITVNELTAQAKIVSKHCNYKVDLWG